MLAGHFHLLQQLGIRLLLEYGKRFVIQLIRINEFNVRLYLPVITVYLLIVKSFTSCRAFPLNVIHNDNNP